MEMALNFCDWSYDLRFTFIYCGTKVKACLRKIVVDVFARTTSDDVVLLANLLGKILCEYVLSFVLQYIYIFYPIYLSVSNIFYMHSFTQTHSLSHTSFTLLSHTHFHSYNTVLLPIWEYLYCCAIMPWHLIGT